MPVNLKLIWSDLVITLIIFAFATIFGAKFVGSGKVSPQFYQHEFAPAVMEACGKGFVVPKDWATASGVANFLALKQDSFDCNQIDPQFEPGKLSRFQEVHRYMMSSVALTWWMNGISWESLMPLYGLLFGLSAVAAYGVFRLGMSKPVAIVLAILFIISPTQIFNLPHYRDYVKTPFIITLVFLLGWMVKNPLPPRKLLLVGCLAGVVLGVGVGFRMDLLVFIPAVLVTIAVFTPGSFRGEIASRFFAMGGFATFFLVLSWPILGAIGDGGNTWHVILLGLTPMFDRGLNIQPSKVYEWLNFYNDGYISSVLHSYGQRIWQIDSPLGLATSVYDKVGLSYYLEIFRMFPADILTRFFASSLSILHYPYYVGLPLWVGGASQCSAFVALLVLSAYNLRIGLFCLVSVLYLSGYPSLQFSERHFFHLLIVPMFFIGFLGQQFFNLGRRFIGLRLSVGVGQFKSCMLLKPGAMKRIGVLLLLFLTTLAALFGLRYYQYNQVSTLLKNYEELSFASQQVTVSNNGDGTFRVRPIIRSSPSEGNNFPVLTNYWGLDIDSDVCDSDRIKIRFQYRYSNSYYDQSRLVLLDASSPLRYIFHTYSTNKGSRYVANNVLSEFDGIDVSEEDLSCIKRFGELQGYEKLPLLMNVTLRDGWQNERLYQKIGREAGDSRSKNLDINVLTFPETLFVSRKQADVLLSRVTNLPENISSVDNKAWITGGVVKFKGNAPASYAYAFQLPLQKTDGEEYLVAEGEVFDGGITLGLLKNHQWAGQVNITTPGKFKIFMKPDAGQYIVTLAHNVPSQKFNHFTLSKLAWVQKDKD